MTIHRALRLLAVATVAACAGPDGDDAATTSGAAVEATTAAPASTEPTSPPTAEPTTTTAPAATTTTVPPVATLTVEAVAQHRRELRFPFSDGDTAIALARVYLPDGRPSSTWVRLDGAGQIIQEGPLAIVIERGLTRSTIEAAGRRFLLAQHGAALPAPCGVREIDTTTLTMGPLLPTRACTARVAVSDTEPSVVWILGSWELEWVDTATGAAGAIPIEGLDRERYGLHALEVLDGIAYVEATVYSDADTEERMTAADGSPLPDVIVRVDPSTATTTSAELGGRDLRLVNRRLVVWSSGDRRPWRVDPTTLTLTAIDPREVAHRTGSSREIWLGADWDGDSHVIDAYQADPTTGARLAEGRLDTGLGRDTTFAGVWVGDDLLAFALTYVPDPAGGRSQPVTDLFRVRQPT